MRKLFVLIFVLAFVILIPAELDAREVKIIINGEETEFTTEPFLENSRTMVPMREAFEALECEVIWDADSKTAIGIKDEKEIRFSIGSYFPVINENPVNAGVPTLFNEGRTFVPLRILGEFTNSFVEWDNETNTIIITDSENNEYLSSYLRKDISVNMADKEKLIELDEISSAEAENIISYRNSAGPLLNKRDLLNVSGIDEDILKNIKNDINFTYIEIGAASWYGSRFHGSRTASGSIFNMYEYTAAHRTLPFGTKVNVISLDTGENVTVTITDRGPHISGRIIDLSYAAASKVGITGVGEVKLEILGSK